MSKLLYVNDENSLSVGIAEELINHIFNMCKHSHPNETGGILIGNYSSDLKRAIVTKVTGAPIDSRRGKTWFQRGTEGLQKLLDDIWDNQGLFYLGEWHYHPDGPATPSNYDIHEMKKISKNRAYNCPEPILIIAGSKFPDDWKVGTYVFVNKSKYITLNLVD